MWCNQLVVLAESDILCLNNVRVQTSCSDTDGDYTNKEHRPPPVMNALGSNEILLKGAPQMPVLSTFLLT